MTTYHTGDTVLVRLLPENHMLNKTDTPQITTGTVVYVHPDQRYIVVDMRIGCADIREGFRQDDARLVHKEGEE